MPRRLGRILQFHATPLIAGAVFLSSVLWHIRGRTHCAFPIALRWYTPTPLGFVPIPDAQIATAWINPNAVLASVDTYGSGPDGRWGQTQQRWNVHVTVVGAGLTAAQIAQLRAQYVDELVAAGDPIVTREMPAIRSADISRTTILWSGWVHNAISMSSLLVLAASLSLVPRRLREHRRRCEGLCPTCAYDLIATPPGSPCPECGAISRRRPATPAPPHL